MNILKAFGLKKARELPSEFGEGKKLSPSEPDDPWDHLYPYITSRDDLRHHIDRQHEEDSREARDRAATIPEPGEGERIHGRTPTDVSDKDPYKNWNVIGGKKGQTLADKREGRSDVGGTRTPQREPAQQWGGGTGGAYRKPKRVAEALKEALKMIGF